MVVIDPLGWVEATIDPSLAAAPGKETEKGGHRCSLPRWEGEQRE